MAQFKTDFDYTAKNKLIVLAKDYIPDDMSPLWEVFNTLKLGEFFLRNIGTVTNLAWVAGKINEGLIDLDQPHPVKIARPPYDAYRAQGPWLIIHLVPNGENYWDKHGHANVFCAQFADIVVLREWINKRRNLKGVPVLDTWDQKAKP